ncbi:substrate-binding periplasmic protein [Undibacterium oligocarboniphilum]|uniref:Transporter substrate-binding domain-containing protein n=1 Tax=Undibacterium oligocarboniphilum TaxID=666702 RepID=A0A850QH85_9BURK|nr:transporter substrate-binding domain-containing protein [Undibacterium oligocarboniphilum]MBC3870551.1 transporter substrate-binding domain-containing protein [Undibacterium oligocarboniphilum]NVO78648.1 transporter substrate-binding domain-containing protein [Undibacterium oligocarboniphilum]
MALHFIDMRFFRSRVQYLCYFIATLLCSLPYFSARAEEFIIQVTSIPPYVLDGPRQGIACDLIAQALATQGIQTKFVRSNNKRMEIDVRSGNADAGFAGIPAGTSNVFFSDPVLEFENVAVTLSDQHLSLRTLSNLADKRVIAFRNAPSILGSEFAAVIKTSSFYFEASEQHSQIPMLDAGRGDVIVLDKRTFLYFAILQYGEQKTRERYQIHSLFRPVPRVLAFHRKEQRDLFNKGLRTIRENGAYAMILRSYLRD